MPTIREMLKAEIAKRNEQNQVPITQQDVVDVMEATKAQAASPEVSQMQQMYDEFARESMAQEQAGLEQLAQQLQEYSAQKPGIDYTALAAWADSLTPGQSNVAQVAQAMRPQTQEERAAKLFQLQNMLQQRRGAMGGRQMQGLQTAIAQQAQADRFAQQQQLANQKFEQEQLRSEAYAKQLNEKNRIDLMKALAAIDAREATQTRADARQEAGLAEKRERRIEDQTIKFEKRQLDAIPLVTNLENIEKHLGFKLENWDPESQTIGGQKIDVPGYALVPGIGPTFAPGSTGEDFHASFRSIFNTVLKDRSGAAVTEPELQRLQAEFAQGKFNTEEKMVTALQRYKEILKKQMRQREAAFTDEVRNRFRERGGYTSQDLFGDENPDPQGLAPRDEVEWNGKKYKRDGDEWVEVNE